MQINFPSGASVKVHLGSYVNVYIKIPATYYNATQGLCGIPDSDVSNELSGKDGKVYQAKRYPNAAFLTSWKYGGFFYEENYYLFFMHFKFFKNHTDISTIV